MATDLGHSEMAGHLIVTLGFVCPFLYLVTTLASILIGLCVAGGIFVTKVVWLLIRLLCVICAICVIGILGCLWRSLINQLELMGV